MAALRMTSASSARRSLPYAKIKTEITLGATVRIRVHSGEIVEGRVAHLWEEKSVPMVRVASGDLVYNVPARMLVNETKWK